MSRNYPNTRGFNPKRKRLNTRTSSQKSAARQFVEFWTGKGYEKGQTQPVWISLLSVIGIENTRRDDIGFEDDPLAYSAYFPDAVSRPRVIHAPLVKSG